jgi:hypothetical protein
MQLPNSHHSIGVRNSSPMMARIGRQRRMAGSRLDGGDGGDVGIDPPPDAPPGACPWAAGRRRGRKRVAGGGVWSLGGKASGGMYGRRSGTGSAVVSGGCRHPPDGGGCRHPPDSGRRRHPPDSGGCRRAAGMSRRRRIISEASLSPGGQHGQAAARWVTQANCACPYRRRHSRNLNMPHISPSVSRFDHLQGGSDDPRRDRVAVSPGSM